MDRSEIASQYLRELGLENRSPDFPFLSDIARQHVARFAFCSVGPRLGEDLPLDLESLFQRIVVRGRGGYCFEQNGLLYELLQELGFSVQFYLARVIYNQDIHPGLTHRITLVDIDQQRYLVDVGFGSNGPALPVSMTGEQSRQANRVFRVFEISTGEFRLQILKDGEYFSLYKFELGRYGQADCELGHFYSHKHPQASFVNHLVVARILGDEIRSLRDREYRVTAASGERISAIEDAGELRFILREQFGIQVTEAESQSLFES